MKLVFYIILFFVLLGLNLQAQDFIEVDNPNPNQEPKKLYYLRVDSSYYLQPFMLSNQYVIQLYDVQKGQYWSPPLMNTQHKSSGFGMRWGKFHHGIDLALPTGSPVFAIFDGVVSKSEFGTGYGNMIEIKHYNGLKTRYGHLSKRVYVGQKIKAGELIGLVGNTGYSTGPHLHFEIWIDKYTINPELVFNFQKSSQQIRSDKLILQRHHFRHYGF